MSLPLSELVLTVHHTTDNYGEPYGHTTMSVNRWDTAEYSPYGLSSYQHPLCNFRLTSQYDTHNPGSYAHVWGFSPEKRDIITINELTIITPLLKSIDRKYTKLCERFGCPTTLGQLAVHLSDSLGIKQACWQTAGKRWHLGNSGADLRYHIDNHIMEWHMQHSAKGSLLSVVG